MAYYPSYQEPPAGNKASNYIWDPNFVSLNGVTGCYRPYSTSDAFPASLMATPFTGTNLAATVLTSGLLFAANPARLSYSIQPMNSGGYLAYSTTGTSVDPKNFHIYLPTGVLFTDNSFKGAISVYISGQFSAFQLS